MKKVLLFASVALATLISCQKENVTVVEEEVQGIPMTLTADFGGATKASFAPDGSDLKYTWDAEESISVVTLDGSGNLLTVDTFTSSGSAGREQAEFSGTFTGGASPANVIAIYPALELSEGKYQTPAYTDYDGYNRHMLGGGTVGTLYFDDSDVSPLRQTADNDGSHLENYCVSAGTADISDIKNNTLSVTLSHKTALFKIVATFPDAYKGMSFDQITIEAYDSSDNEYRTFRGGSWEYINIAANGINGSGSIFYDTNSIYGNFNIPDTGVVTLYMPYTNVIDCETGNYWNFTATANSTNLPTVKKTFTSSFEIERGKMYTINVTFTE